MTPGPPAKSPTAYRCLLIRVMKKLHMFLSATLETASERTQPRNRYFWSRDAKKEDVSQGNPKTHASVRHRSSGTVSNDIRLPSASGPGCWVQHFPVGFAPRGVPLHCAVAIYSSSLSCQSSSLETVIAGDLPESAGSFQAIRPYHGFPACCATLCFDNER